MRSFSGGKTSVCSGRETLTNGDRSAYIQGAIWFGSSARKASAAMTAPHSRDDALPIFSSLCASLYCAIRALKSPDCTNRDRPDSAKGGYPWKSGCARFRAIAPGLGDGVSWEAAIASDSRKGTAVLSSSMSGEHDRRGCVPQRNAVAQPARPRRASGKRPPAVFLPSPDPVRCKT